VGRKLFDPGAPVIDPKTLQRKSVHSLNHKMDQVVLGHPLTKIRRQKHRRLSSMETNRAAMVRGYQILRPIQSPTDS
jgi:hypothetical protein